MKNLGYKRVSSKKQKFIRQNATLDELKLDKIFVEKVSGKNRSRPELESLLAYMREGDHIYVHSIDRLARNALDLLTLVKEITQKKVSITFVKDNMTFNNKDDSHIKLQLTMLAAFAEFERNIAKSRQREAIEAILEHEKDFKREDKTFKGKPPLHKVYIDKIRELEDEGVTIAATVGKLKLSRTTVWKYRRKNR